MKIKDKKNMSTLFYYHGLNDYQANYLKYLLKNCLDLTETEIESINIFCQGYFLKIEILGHDRGPIKFMAEGSYDYNLNILTIKSLVKKGEEEPFNATDTFYFNEDEIIIKSNEPYYNAPFINRIPKFMVSSTIKR